MLSGPKQNIHEQHRHPFFCSKDKHLLYALADGIWSASCDSDFFLKCMFYTREVKNESMSHFIHANFFECIQIMVFDT